MSPFSAPFFWGTQKRRLLLPKRAAALWEGTQWCKGGTGKAEAVKLEFFQHHFSKMGHRDLLVTQNLSQPTNNYCSVRLTRSVRRRAASFKSASRQRLFGHCWRV